MKKCKVCGDKYEPKFTSFQKTCNEMACILAWGKKEKERKALAENRKKKKAAREGDRAYWLRRTQTEFNKYIRTRDKGKPCISCGRVMTGQVHAGHYRSVGAHPELRFEPDNCHAQCAQCNNWKSGNLTEYRANLLVKIGQERIEWLEGPHEKSKLGIPELKELLAHYKGLTDGNSHTLGQTI